MLSSGGFCLLLLMSSAGLVILIEAEESITVEVHEGVIVGRAGSTINLPCWIAPQQNAEVLEIRWYRPERFDTPVLFYRDGKIQDVQEKPYRNRSFLTLRSDQSNGLKDGDVSLRLENLNIQDEGVYHCYVSGQSSHDHGTITLNITALGCTPVLFSQPVDDTHLNISCRSSGWFPKPNITWMSDRSTVLSAGGISQSRGADGTFSVHTWMLVSPSDTQQVFCYLSLSSGEERDGRMKIQAIHSSDGPWKALFFVTVALLCLLFGFILYKNREKLTGKKTTNNKMINKEIPFSFNLEDIEELRKNKAMITLDRKSAHPNLKISEDLKSVRDSLDCQESGRKSEEFPYELCVCGAQTFSSGCHYWEFLLAVNNTNPKNYWLIGVKENRKFSGDKTSLTPSNGFWFLCSNGPNGIYTNTEPPVILSPALNLQHVGVQLDYDNGTLAFYDVKEAKHLLTMRSQFSGSVVPLFNPGVGDQCPMRILDIPEPAESPVESSQPLLQETRSSV